MTAIIKLDSKCSETGNWSDKGPEEAKQQARASQIRQIKVSPRGI